jgi:large subunit ribosomal protein L15
LDDCCCSVLQTADNNSYSFFFFGCGGSSGTRDYSATQQFARQSWCREKEACGRGHKGQKARSGGSIHPTFEGGQTKFYKLFPKRGFKNTRHETVMNGVNLGTIQTYIDMQRLDPEKPITVTALKDAGLFKPSAVKHGVKLLASGKEMLKQPLTIQLNRASASAVEAVEAFEGGSVQTVHYNKLALRTALRPEKFVDKYQPKHARPPPKWQPYYTSWHKRGYLNPAVQMRGWFEKQQQPDVTATTTTSAVDLESKFEELLSISKKKFAVNENDQA